MSTGTSKTRTQRLATLTAVPTRLHLAIMRFRQRSAIFGFLIFLATFAVFILSLKIWNPPFPYYTGMPINRDIVARVAFETIDTAETEKERVLAADRVPNIYVRNIHPETLDENIETIYRILKDASAVDSFDKLSPELQQQFMLPDDSEGSDAETGTKSIWQFLSRNPEPEAEKTSAGSTGNAGNAGNAVGNTAGAGSTGGAAGSSASAVETPAEAETKVPGAGNVEGTVDSGNVASAGENAKTAENSETKSSKKPVVNSENETKSKGSSSENVPSRVVVPPIPAVQPVAAPEVPVPAAPSDTSAPSDSSAISTTTDAPESAIPASSTASEDVTSTDVTSTEDSSHPSTVIEQEEKEELEEDFEEEIVENPVMTGANKEKALSEFCDVLKETMKPFCEHGLMHIAEVKDDPLGRGLQVQITIVDSDTPHAEGERAALKSVILEDNDAIRTAIRKIVGKNNIGDLIYYCICRNWKSNLVQDTMLTNQAIQNARQKIVPVKKEYQVSQRIVLTQVVNNSLIGTLLTEDMVKLLSIENEKWLQNRTWNDKLIRGVAVGCLLLLVLASAIYYISLVEPRIIREPKRQTFILIFSVLVIWVTIWCSTRLSLPRSFGLFPLVIFGQILSFQYRRRVGIIFSSFMLLCLSVVLGMSQLEVLCVFTIQLSAILPLDRLRGRMQFVRISILCTVMTFVLYISWDAMMGVPLERNIFQKAAINSVPLLFEGLVMQSMLPLLERWLGILSDVRLLELCDISNPLLNELVNRAPSTYSHSIAVGTIGENAADAIHANGLLVRTAAYYHDIGKIYKPNYYAENLIVKEDTPHKTLEPTMSALIIIAHVKNGVDLARQYKLPQQIIDLIEQHHGSTLVAYFYNQAKNECVKNPNIPDVEESSFRYPCSRPQTKEAVVLMLADSCESACRALVEPTPARIQGLVRKISQDRLEDEQFDECDITLKELRIVEDHIIKVLISNHHGRIKYPERIKDDKNSKKHD